MEEDRDTHRGVAELIPYFKGDPYCPIAQGKRILCKSFQCRGISLHVRVGLIS